jgi:fumarylacetoacetate (FAA) hydrolase
MKLVSYLKEGHDQLAAYIDGYLYDMENLHPDLPNNMSMFLNYWEESLSMAMGGEIMVKEGKISKNKATAYENVQLLAPVPFPASYRSSYTFRQQIAATQKNKKEDRIAAFDQYPVFYFGNHHSIQGPGEIRCMPDHFEKLDFELQVAIVICKHGRNIRAADADEHIGGLMIMNGLSTRQLLNAIDIKGKDFATATGPWLVTTDELEEYKIPAQANHAGSSWSLSMQCFVNGQGAGEGNIADMEWPFAEIIERASYGVDLLPGDVIGSGAVGNVCFLELNQNGLFNNANHVEQWLQEGDRIEMEIEGLGKLSNHIVREEEDFSILEKRK